LTGALVGELDEDDDEDGAGQAKVPVDDVDEVPTDGEGDF